MAMGMREELDQDELDGDGDEGGARRGGRLGAALPSCPTAVGPGTDPTAVCASALETCWR
jgi:hypothetical protein